MYVYICTHSVFLVKTSPHPGEDFFLCFQTLRFHISWQGLTTLRISPVLEFSQVPMHWASSGGRRLWEFPWCGLSMMLNWILLDVLASITIHYGNLYQPIITREFWYFLLKVGSSCGYHTYGNLYSPTMVGMIFSLFLWISFVARNSSRKNLSRVWVGGLIT